MGAGLVYVDDGIVVADFEPHRINLDMLVVRLRRFGLHLKLSKCAFAQHRLRFLNVSCRVGALMQTQKDHLGADDTDTV